MSGSISNVANFGSFLPTTSSWEIQQIQQSNLDPQLKEVLIRIYQNLNKIYLVTNTKDSAIYDTQEFLTGQIYFNTVGANAIGSGSTPYRPVFRKVIDFGPLPNATSKTIPHNIDINAGYIFTRVYGTATDPLGQQILPLPYSSPTLNQNITLLVSSTNIDVTTAVDFSSITNCYIVLEYIKG